ncbi:type II toxin-antitoxin system VapC family toxin [Devosia sp.]|uniref:type II toxin-antitoxin system VapC family toxin n=1 Tax=Devosia sp. TaxID=1871048 RepID=UPI002EEDB95D
MATSTRLLLDTCAAIWITEDAPLADAAARAIDGAFHEGRPIFVSPITAWERGVLVAKGRLASPITPHAWFSRLVAETGFAVADLSPEILIDSSFLPGAIHNDPADRILVATARAMDLVVVTRDRKILTYAEEGHVRALAC